MFKTFTYSDMRKAGSIIKIWNPSPEWYFRGTRVWKWHAWPSDCSCYHWSPNSSRAMSLQYRRFISAHKEFILTPFTYLSAKSSPKYWALAVFTYASSNTICLSEFSSFSNGSKCFQQTFSFSWNCISTTQVPDPTLTAGVSGSLNFYQHICLKSDYSNLNSQHLRLFRVGNIIAQVLILGSVVLISLPTHGNWSNIGF